MSSRSPIRGILFDKDGTLVDYEASWNPVNRRAARLAARGDAALAGRLLAQVGADPHNGRAVADSIIAAGTTLAIATAWVAGGAPFTVADLTGELDTLFRDSAAHMVPVTDLAALFARLKSRGLKLGIASSDNEASIHALLAAFGLGGVLDFIAGYDSGYAAKPDPAVLAAFCAATGLVPSQVAMVGDNTHDVAMGWAGGAGLSIGVLTGTGTRASLTPSSDLCLDSVADLEAALFEIG
ncbi:HAD family hydrolase [Oleomonas cavernae]|uniref:phosphoglycolate phosphatase n=1 Tax=Oleomonas cavernae TaxID=2320859 RepID=A0A418WFX9_9PROT|nr:HAD family hydrolase [Oleomonas cavernae]RJF88934.1 HAD family hydrolase [Oleomonas cavernae]